MRKIISLSLFLLFIVGCSHRSSMHDSFSDLNTASYDTEECKKELQYCEDFKTDKAIDMLRIVKKSRKMYLYSDGRVQGIIPVSLGQNPNGHKQQEGDLKTPEGQYYITQKVCSPKYFRSLAISYPNAKDIAKAQKNGVKPGGDIMIHAQPVWNANGRGDNYTLSKDWTRGCIAVTNNTMLALWYRIKVGVPIVIE